MTKVASVILKIQLNCCLRIDYCPNMGHGAYRCFPF